MLRLTTFDGVVLTQEGRPVAGVQNRRQSLALLLMLAVHDHRGMSRDRIIELLWPDDSVKDPRHSLDQLLSVTRMASGSGDLFSEATTLRLNPDVVRTDVSEFEAARRDHRLEELAALYRAPFADGFPAGASPALERFLDDARTRFALEHSAAVRTLAERAESRGAHAEAARWWRVWHETDRLNGEVAVRLVASLAAAGRPGDALRVARGYATLLRLELGREDSEIMRWMGRLDGTVDNGASGVGAVIPVRPDEGRAPRGSRAARGSERLQRVVGGRYRLEKVLRTGQIASAYLAVDGEGERGMVEVQLMEEPVASMAPPDQFEAVFRRVTTLSHAGILPTLDAGIDGTLRYVVTAVRPQETLKARLERERPLPIDEALSLAHDLAAGLAHAHARGVPHGDIRPKQIALAGERACLCAFGFAESILQGDDMGGGSAVLTLGSTAYHSPEQLMGEVRLDARSDVYSIGCVLFEMLAGSPPFGGANGRPNLLKLTGTPPSLHELRETVPASLSHVVQTCLARVPADRYLSGEALLRALADIRWRAPNR